MSPLAGRRILVTRPRERASGLADLIREAGGDAILFPAIEIRELDDLQPFYRIADHLEDFDLAVFISPTAVQRALDLLRSRRGETPWPPGLRLAAVGPGSQRELERRGFRGVIAPADHADSEALLALPALAAMSGQRVVIFRGAGGRELLAEILLSRGARVEVAECYRRVRPEPLASPPVWAQRPLDAVTVSSSEGLANVVALLGGLRPEWLEESPVFVPHPRVADEVMRLGARETVVSGAGDEEIARRLVAYFRDAK